MNETIKLKLNRLREKIWFRLPYWAHVIDYKISEFLFNSKICAKLFKSRGLRYFPREVQYVDPNQIKHYDRHRYFSSIYYVQAGDWDLQKVPIEEKLQQRFIKELIQEGKDVKALTCLSEYIEKIAKGTTSPEQAVTIIEDKAEKCRQLHKKMQKSGCLTQKELGKSSWNRFNTWYDEIRVSIDRNGEYILNGSGNHRLAIAQLLKLKRVPVVVIRMHYQYYVGKT